MISGNTSVGLNTGNMNGNIVNEVLRLRDEIVANYYGMKLNASGRFDKETKVEDYGAGVKIISPAHYMQMENGRAAGTMPPVSAIKQWIKDKNANAGTNIPEEAAFAIAYVIKRDGIKVPNKFNKGGVATSILTPQRVEQLIMDITRIVRVELIKILTK